MTPIVRIVVANSPRSYRQAHAAMLRHLHPDAEVILTDPGDLDGAIARHAPHLVLCSELTDTVRRGSLAWVLLYPGGADLAVACVDGAERTLAAVELNDLSAVVDETRRRLTMRAGGVEWMAQSEPPEARP